MRSSAARSVNWTACPHSGEHSPQDGTLQFSHTDNERNMVLMIMGDMSSTETTWFDRGVKETEQNRGGGFETTPVPSLQSCIKNYTSVLPPPHPFEPVVPSLTSRINAIKAVIMPRISYHLQTMLLRGLRNKWRHSVFIYVLEAQLFWTRGR